MNKTIRYALLGISAVILTFALVYLLFPGIFIERSVAIARWQAGLETHYQQVGQHRWPYLEGGAEHGETIVFIHGFSSKKEYWIGMMEHFAGQYHVITPDIPGFGDNKIIEGADYRIPAQVDRLNRFLEAMEVNAFHIAGCSMGGWIAGYYASEHPEKVLSLALIDSAGVISAETSQAHKHLKETGENLLVPSDAEGYKKMMAVVFHDPPPIPDRLAEAFIEQRMQRLDSEKIMFRALRQSQKDNLEERLHLIQAKTLIIWGGEDQIIDISAMRILHRGIKQSQTAVLEKVGHAPHLEALDKTANTYRQFLDTI